MRTTDISADNLPQEPLWDERRGAWRVEADSGLQWHALINSTVRVLSTALFIHPAIIGARLTEMARDGKVVADQGSACVIWRRAATT